MYEEGRIHGDNIVSFPPETQPHISFYRMGEEAE